MSNPVWPWHKSSYSGGNDANCVEVAESASDVRVRDTQNRQLGHLSFNANEWTTFLQEIKDGSL